MKNSLLTLVVVALMIAAPRADATIIEYSAALSGLNESPPNDSTATGFAQATVDDVLGTLTLDVSFSGLTAPTTAAHIHCCTALPMTDNAGAATTVPSLLGFPLGVVSGNYFDILDLNEASTYNPAFVTDNGGTLAGAQAALLNGLAEGKAYLNIHTSAYPAGEIRGFFTVSQVPEPSTLILLGLGLAVFGWRKYGVNSRLRRMSMI